MEQLIDACFERINFLKLIDEVCVLERKVECFKEQIHNIEI